MLIFLLLFCLVRFLCRDGVQNRSWQRQLRLFQSVLAAVECSWLLIFLCFNQSVFMFLHLSVYDRNGVR